MRITIIAAGALLLASASAFAQFEGPTVKKITTVAEAKQAPDDTAVLLTGQIVAHVRDDDYIFRDNTGEMQIEIDDDQWKGRKVTPDTTIRISGEVDRETWGAEIDVDSFEILSDGAAPEKGGFRKQ